MISFIPEIPLSIDFSFPQKVIWYILASLQALHIFSKDGKKNLIRFSRVVARDKTGDKALKAMRVSRFIVFILISFFFLELIVEMF